MRLINYVMTLACLAGCATDVGAPAPSVLSHATPEIQVFRPIDWTEPTDFTATICRPECVSENLRVVEADRLLDYAPGRYEDGLNLGGPRIEIFPDLTYAIVAWCDICDVTPLEIGTWSHDGNRLSLQATKTASEAKFPDGIAILKRMFGDYRVLRFFVTSDGTYIRDAVITGDDLVNHPDMDVENSLSRMESYVDWPSLRDRLRLEMQDVQ
jgi:hypothetical protein